MFHLQLAECSSHMALNSEDSMCAQRSLAHGQTLAPAQVVKRLAEKEGLLLLPGRAFGAPGMLRLSYGGLRTLSEACVVAQKLERAARDLCGIRAL